MRTDGSVLVRGLFGLIGLVAGVAGGWYALDLTGSWALAVFVFAMASYVLTRGIPDVITDPDKGRRIAFFGIPPIIGVAALAGAYWLWDTWWLAVVIGFVAYFIGFGVASMAFPKIALEEHADDRSRLGLGREAPAVTTGSPRRFSSEQATTMLSTLEESGVRMSPDEQRRFIGLIEAGQPEQAMEMISERMGRQTTTPKRTLSDKYANKL